MFRFLAEDSDSGRREYLISRSTMLDVTDLTLTSVRVSDPRVVSITNNILQGHSPGTVTVQVNMKIILNFDFKSVKYGDFSQAKS